MARYRLQYSFWLDHNNADDVTVADTVERLKNQRSFTQVVKDGIMLVTELRQGKTDLLLKLFPEIVAKLAPPANSGGGGNLESRIIEMEKVMRDYRNNQTPFEGPLVAAPPPLKPYTQQPVAQVKAAAVDAGAIADDFLAFLG